MQRRSESVVRPDRTIAFCFNAPGRYIGKDFLAAEWGAFIVYMEVADDQYATRQIDVFDNGKILRYDRTHWCDDFATMSRLKFSRKPKWTKYYPGAKVTDAAEFEKVWRVALRSELWVKQIASSRVPQWGVFRIG